MCLLDAAEICIGILHMRSTVTRTRELNAICDEQTVQHPWRLIKPVHDAHPNRVDEPSMMDAPVAPTRRQVLRCGAMVVVEL